MWALYLIISNLILVGLIEFSSTNRFDDINNPRYVNEILRFAKSAEIRNYLNESHNPCDDFYNFACGSYGRLNPPTTLQYQKNVFQSISKSLNRKISRLLKSHEATDTATDKKVKYFYESCMNAGNLEKDYTAKLQEIIREFGQMPAVEGDKWPEQEFDWLKTVAEIAHKYNIHLILGYFIDVDNFNNTLNRIRVLVQDIPLQSAAIYTEAVHEPLREIRKKEMVKNLKNFLGLEELLAEETAREIFEFERHLFADYKSTQEETSPKEIYYDPDEDANVTKELYDNINEEEYATEDVSEEDNEKLLFESSKDLYNNTENDTIPSSNEEYTSNLVTNLITIEEMQSKYFPHLDIERLINISLGFIPTEPVYDLIEDQFANIVIVLQMTPKRIVANYIFYHLLEAFMLTTPKDMQLLSMLCIKKTKSNFAKVIDNMIYRKYITKQTEQEVEDMWHTIKSSFQNVLQSERLAWMMDDTRQYALEKLKSIRLEINAYQKTNFTKEFGPLKINQDDYIENTKSILVLSALNWRSKYNESPQTYENPQLLSFTPVYIYVENLIKVPMSILQPYHFWSKSYSNALKFGTLGFFIAHELIHGFDENGRTYDKWGNKHEWWDEASNEYFNNRIRCFGAQYHEYIYEGIRLPLLESQSENTADNGGIRLAYNAYLHWYEESLRSDLESMPLLDYTNKQLFFISYGQMWCSVSHPIVRNYLTSIDEHVPNKFRLIGPLSNLEEFSTEFQCPQGSGMNPKNKCIIY